MKELQLLQEQHSDLDEQDAADIEASLGLQRGEPAQQDGEMEEDNDDEGMEDDMMDKISSSPSIDDGGYPNVLPAGVEGCPSTPVASTFLSADSEPPSSSPFTTAPEHLPLGYYLHRKESETSLRHRHCHQHMPGGYPSSAEEDNASSAEDLRSRSASPSASLLSWVPLLGENGEPYAFRGDIPGADWTPRAKPRRSDTVSTESSEDSLATVKLSSPNDDDDDVINDYDRGEISSDERFVDSGYGGESLRELEDIDFEFVYALHTFVATVEGQANATKGDTMVLLDDSNSYWWLVRVVKDSSIGMCEPGSWKVALIPPRLSACRAH